MTSSELESLLQALIHGDLTPEEHGVLQAELKRNPDARAQFRELMDLETGIRSWALESEPVPVRSSSRRWKAVAALAAGLLLLLGATWMLWPSPSEETPTPVVTLGGIREQRDCVWAVSPSNNRVSAQSLSLLKGAAELTLDSGTTLVMEGPCDLRIVSEKEAKLLSGTVVVKATELSAGFTLQTPEASIVDEGAQYAVSLTDEDTEVHVVEGLTHWEPRSSEMAPEEIKKGEARRYHRSNPGRGHRIPFARRKFVWELQEKLRQSTDGKLLAYDGFEYLAGRLRRGRSGIGWNEGWRNARRGRGRIGRIVDAPNDVVFGMKRGGRRLLELANRESLLRELHDPVSSKPDSTLYLSFLFQWEPRENESRRFFRVALSDVRNRRRLRDELAFGITSEGFPFIKVASRTTQTAAPIEDQRAYLGVVKVQFREDQKVDAFFRVYHPNEVIPDSEPQIWTTIVRDATCECRISGVVLSVGIETRFQIDELKIGTTWRSVSPTTSPSKKPS